MTDCYLQYSISQDKMYMYGLNHAFLKVIENYYGASQIFFCK